MDNRYKSKQFWKYNRGNMLKKNIFDIKDLLLIDKAIYNDIVEKIFFEEENSLINNKFGEITKRKRL